MKRLSQSGSSNFCPELRKNALLISQSHFSNFALHVIRILMMSVISGHASILFTAGWWTAWIVGSRKGGTRLLHFQKIKPWYTIAKTIANLIDLMLQFMCFIFLTSSSSTGLCKSPSSSWMNSDVDANNDVLLMLSLFCLIRKLESKNRYGCCFLCVKYYSKDTCWNDFSCLNIHWLNNSNNNNVVC